MEAIIRTEELSKHFKKVQAVRDLSLHVNKGEIYGFLGLNGAGKTTTIRMLLGMIKPTSGFSLINGQKVRAGNHELWKNIGYMVEIPYAYPDLTVRENLEIIRRLRLMKDHTAVSRIMDHLKLGNYENRKARHLSQGNKQRLGLAKALIHDPEILILDEPTNGLDPAGIVEIRELLLNVVHNRGVTVFISSHILGEMSKIATRIGIIHHGVLTEELDTQQMEQIRQKKLVVQTRDMETGLTALSAYKDRMNITDEGSFEITDPEAIRHPDQVATHLVKAGVPPVLLKVEEEDLESYFLRTIGMKGEPL